MDSQLKRAEKRPLLSSKSLRYIHPYLMEGTVYETRQSSLLFNFVRFFALDHAQNTIVVCY